MTRYCLDTNVLIQAKNGPYGFDFAPAFWEFLDRQFNDRVIYTSLLVYEELSNGGDELAKWVQNRRNSDYFIEPNREVQIMFQQISDYVINNYPNHQAQLFLNGADPWVISQAKVDSSIVVTHETIVPANSERIKIPNICRLFKVQFINPYQMLRILRAKL